jgi:hypothetical protein
VEEKKWKRTVETKSEGESIKCEKRRKKVICVKKKRLKIINDGNKTKYFLILSEPMIFERTSRCVNSVRNCDLDV